MKAGSFRLIGVLGGVLLTGAVAFATAPLPSTPTYLGLNKTVIMNGQSNGQLGYAAGGAGGEFAGTLAGFSTAFWCIDDQLYSKWGQTATGNVAKLDAINTTPASQVRYGNVTNGAGNPHWTNTVANGEALPDTTGARYQMAAWLISQYVGFNVTVDGSTAANKAVNDAIQHAIWAITNNNSKKSDNSPSHLNGNPWSSTTALSQNASAYQTVQSDTVSQTSDGYWIKQALANYTGINPAHWAVVSWGADANGSLYTGGYNSATPALQTFLVQTAPEPGFYGVLALGLSGLYFLARARRRSQRQ